MEIWRPIPGTDGYYEASDLGRVRSLDKVTRHNYGGTRTQRGRILKTRTTKDGYEAIVIFIAGRPKSTFAHRLVCAAFHGVSDKRTVNHKDGVKSNNVPSNLEWATYEENQRHADRMGLRTPNGIGNGRAKLSEADVLTIRSTKQPLVYGEASIIARKYGVSPTMIRYILKGANWKCLQPVLQ